MSSLMSGTLAGITIPPFRVGLLAGVRLVISRLVLVFILPLDFHGRIRVVGTAVHPVCSPWH